MLPTALLGYAVPAFPLAVGVAAVFVLAALPLGETSLFAQDSQANSGGKPLPAKSKAMEPYMQIDPAQQVVWPNLRRRAEMISLQPNNNIVKPLATTDFAGWSYFSDILVGSYSPDWLAGYSLARREYVWFSSSKGELSVPPQVLGSSMILGFKDGVLQRIDPLTGRESWTISLDSYPNRAITMVGNVLLVSTASQILYAIDFQTGKTEWLYDAGFPESIVLSSQSAPISHAGVIYFGVHSGELVAIDAKSGAELWRFSPAYSESRFKDVVGELAVVGNVLVMSRYDGFVGGLRLAESASKVEVIWKHQLSSITTSLVRDGRYFVSTSTGEVMAFDAQSGNRFWKVQIGESAGRMAADETNLFIAGNTGMVAAIQMRDGQVEWYDQLDAKLSAPPLLHEDRVYFFTGLKNIYSYRLSKGLVAL
jgi:outer membrane protein assembly factor BamB